jgi:hypothetical protein
MSSPAPPRTPVPLNPMRQQLDELDALLQRMLALPVNHLEDSPKPQFGDLAPPLPVNDDRPWIESAATPRERPVSPQPAAAPAQARSQGTLVVLQSLANPAELTVANPDRGQTDALADIPVIDSPATAVPASAKGWGPDAEMPNVPGVDVNAETPCTSVEPERADFLSDMPSPFLERHQARIGRRMNSEPIWQRPLQWVNQGFDALAIRLGAPGLWVLSPRGRATIGWMGLGMIAAALTVLVLDWIGWTW